MSISLFACNNHTTEDPIKELERIGVDIESLLEVYNINNFDIKERLLIQYDFIIIETDNFQLFLPK